jgi:hyperosmotically inducible periplasmic protein
MARKNSLQLLAFGAATALALGAATTGCGNERVSDATISESVSKRLDAEPALAAYDIGVETENGMVTIDGRVPGQDQRAEAERIARSTAGVKAVANLIEVAGSISPPPSPGSPPGVGSPPPPDTGAMPDREGELP